MARTVRDAALLLAAMAGVDPRDAATDGERRQSVADLIAGSRCDALKGARIGVLRGPFAGYSPASDSVVDAAVAKLKALGAEVIDPVELPNAGKYDDSELDVLQYEFKADLNAYLATRRGSPSRRSPTSSRSTRRTATRRCRTSVRSCSSRQRRRARSPMRRTKPRSRRIRSCPARRASTRR